MLNLVTSFVDLFSREGGNLSPAVASKRLIGRWAPAFAGEHCQKPLVAAK